MFAPRLVWAQPSNATNPQVLCFGAIEPYCVDCPASDPGGSPGSTYTWEIISGPFAGSIGTNPAFPSQNHITIDWGTSPAGNYVLQVTESNAQGCAGDPRILNITIQEFPVTVNSGTICSGGNFTLTATTTQPGGTFLWSNGETTQSITVNPTTTTNYTVTYSVPFCSEVEGTGTVTVTPAPTVTVTNETICSGGTATLTATASEAGGTFTWSTGETGASITVNPTVTTSYDVVYTLNDCTPGEGTGTVTVTPAPTVTVTNETICFGGSATLTATASEAGGTFTWSTGETGPSITVNPTVTTSYDVVYTLNDCTPGEGSGTVNVNPEIITSPISHD